MPALLGLAALLALAQVPAASEPPIPSREVHQVSAECRGRSIEIAYTISRPGPDMFSAISIGGDKLPDQEVARLNQLLGGYMLDGVSIYSCEGEGGAYELKLHLKFSRGEERHIYLMGVARGRIRVIR